VDFILASTIVFYMHWAIKKNLAVFNLADFHNSPNRQNKFYTKFSSHTVDNYNVSLVASLIRPHTGRYRKRGKFRWAKLSRF